MTRAADCLPRLSPPAASPAFRAAMRRRGKGRVAGFFVGARGFRDHLGAGEHVAGDGEAGADRVAAPGDAGVAGVGGDGSGGVLDVELTRRAAFVGGGEDFDDGSGGCAFAEHAEAARAVGRVDEGLCRERADAAERVRAERADGEEARRDGDAEGAGFRVAGDDGPGHRRRRRSGNVRRESLPGFPERAGRGASAAPPAPAAPRLLRVRELLQREGVAHLVERLVAGEAFGLVHAGPVLLVER